MVKFLLCRPQGGLNDIMVQVEECCKYGERFGRIVIVDTDYQNSITFRDKFSNYFVSKQENFVLDASPYLGAFESLLVYPNCLTGKINTYQAKWHEVNNKFLFVEKETATPIQFDFETAFEEDVLVHHQCGGGAQAISLGKRLTITQNLFEELVYRLDSIHGEFDAVHIRHTEMKSNYHEAIEQLQKKYFTKLFVATDNRSMLEIIRSTFPEKSIISFSRLPEKAGQPIFFGYTDVPIKIANREAILDLFTLAFAKSLTLCRATNNPYNEYSGYSLFAKKLNEKGSLLTAFFPKQEILI